ncbi:hypothetical protein L596_028747 [Steinernema carpocapsae]|uniref:Uncharacterized protein n=1 Tax=Steinernema carpocapsae TaxID=34508 RepID=A0A4U5LZD7_STECR|nr:hypothetical protein L596_028747 [Steinernema carpocapsae]
MSYTSAIFALMLVSGVLGRNNLSSSDLKEHARAVIVTDIDYVDDFHADLNADTIHSQIEELLEDSTKANRPEWKIERSFDNVKNFLNIEYFLKGEGVCDMVLHYAELAASFCPEVYYIDAYCNGEVKSRFYRHY